MAEKTPDTVTIRLTSLHRTVLRLGILFSRCRTSGYRIGSFWRALFLAEECVVQTGLVFNTGCDIGEDVIKFFGPHSIQGSR